MAENERILVGRRLPALATVRALEPYRVQVTWAHGERSGEPEIVDLSPMIERFTLYRPLRASTELFADARLGPYGSSIEWADGEIDLSADALEDIAFEADAQIDFKGFLDEQGWTFDLAARRLGLGRRTVAYYAAGRPLPRTVALACKAFVLAREERSWSGGSARNRVRRSAA